MTIDINFWRGAEYTHDPKEWTCWSCGTNAGGQWGYRFYSDGRNKRYIYICPHCGAPVYFPDASSNNYEPKALPGVYMDKLPNDMSSLYIEIRRCISAGAYTSAVLTSRKLLMHIAVDMGHKPGGKFAPCVKYICENGYPGKSGQAWVDCIRQRGNEANHEIAIMSKDDAMQMLKFLELILNGNYQAMAEIAPAATDAECVDISDPGSDN